jgi:hypothetical protein
MPKKVKKVELQIGYATLTPSSKIDFPKEYNNWASTCGKLRGAAIGTKQGTLRTALETHAKKVRPKSKNKGSTGVQTIFAKINSELLPSNGHYGTSEMKVLESIERTLNRWMQPEHKLNPANIMFTRPIKHKNGVYAENAKTKPIYGHYLDDFFAARHNKTAVDSSWIKDKLGEARPPMYQALFGGKMFTEGKSLLEIVQKGIEQIPNQEFTAIIDSPLSDLLVTIPQIKSATTGWLRSATYGNEVSVGTMRTKMEGRIFHVKGEGDVIREYGNLGNFEGEIVSYRLDLDDKAIEDYVLAYWNSLKGLAGKKGDSHTFAKSWKNQLKGWVFVA